MKGWALALVVVISSTGTGRAQLPNVKVSSKLELRLEAGDVRDGLPHSFTFVIVNISKQEVRVPIPVAGCSNAAFGTAWLRFKLDPEPGGVPCGCTGGYGDLPSVLIQAQTWWKVLSPGESFAVKVPPEQLCYDEKSAKSIEFWAHYDPPVISVADRRALAEAGIDFPQSEMESAHSKFVKKR